MPAQNKTSLGLNQWLGNEYPKRIDFVEDNQIINYELEKRVKNTDLATDTEAGILTLNKVREVAPQPDLTPYVRGDNSYIHKDNKHLLSRHDKFVRCNNNETWTSPHLHMYYNDNINQYQGTFHVNGGRAYYKVPGRNGGNFNEIMDNHDMAARDHRMNAIDGNVNNAYNRGNDAWHKANDAQLNRVANMRLTSFISIGGIGGVSGLERHGYVVTGLWGDHTRGTIHGSQMRCLQFQFGHGGWVTAWG